MYPLSSWLLPLFLPFISLWISFISVSVHLFIQDFPHYPCSPKQAYYHYYYYYYYYYCRRRRHHHHHHHHQISTTIINNHYQQLLSTTNINIIYINDKHYRFHSILLMTSGGSWRPSRKARAAAWNATGWSRRRRCSKRRQRGARNVWMVYFMEILLKWMITRGIALW